MKIVFIGQEQAGYDVLKMLLRCREDVIGVFTSPNSDKIADWVDFNPLLKLYPEGCRHIYTGTKFIDQDIKRIVQMHPDLIIVVSWSEIIPKAILDIAPTIGIHYSLLPKRRGGAPIAWALIDGLKESGITLFYYSEKVDAGDIIAQKKFRIYDEGGPRRLLHEINKLCVDIIWENLPKIKDGTAPRIKQDESMATYTKKRTPADSMILPECDITPACKLPELILEPLYDFIRGLDDPYPNAYINYHGLKISFSNARLSPGNGIACNCIITEVGKNGK